MHMRQGAFTKTFTVSQGVLGKAGTESARARTHTHGLSHPLLLFVCFWLCVKNVDDVFTLNVKIFLCASNAFELYSVANNAPFHALRCSRMMTSNPVQQNSTSSRIAVLLVM